VLHSLSQHIQSEQKHLNPSMIKKMLQFINDNSHKDISLLDLADYLNLSRNYVSSLFKEATGSNFKDFLNKQRYDMACKIIAENPSKKIKDVAVLVGCSTDILIRLFLRYGGMRPHDYQKQAMDRAKNNALM
jgi:two-component system, response regulator YesN